MSTSRSKLLLYVSLALCASRAHALGLGDAIGAAVIGEPLRIEIPLFGSGSVAPSPACFKIAPPLAEIGNEFVLRNARVDVVPGQGGSRLVVTTGAPVREPLVGFAISAGCEFGLARDYVLLSSVPSPAAAVASPAAAPATAPMAAPASTPAEGPTAAAAIVAPAVRTEAPAASAETMRLERDATLTALARQKYPLQPKAREKFVRMMLQANPNLADGDAIVGAGSVLNVPPGLPVRREGPPPQAKPATPETAVQPAASAAKRKPNPGSDRLVLGAAPVSSEAQLLDEAERLTEILLSQTKGQEELLETIGRLEKSYAELRKEFVRVESQLAAVEAQRKAEKAAAGQSFDLFTLIAAILGGGAMGSLLLHFHQRRKPGRDAGAANAHWWMTSEKAPEKPRLKLASTKTAQPPEDETTDVLDFHTQPGTKP